MAICDICSDTHKMWLGEDKDREVMCTHCPSPCAKCGDRGPYCLKTPCDCECHANSFRYERYHAQQAAQLVPVGPRFRKMVEIPVDELRALFEAADTLRKYLE